MAEKLNSGIECKNSILLIVISVGIAVFRLKTVGFFNLLARSTSTYAASENGSLSLLIEKCMQALSYFLAAIAVLDYKKNRGNVCVLVICLVCLFISYPPTGIARYAAAAICFGMLLTFSELLKKKNIFIFILVGLFAVAMPALNAFRNLTFDQVDLLSALKAVINNYSTVWLAGDYDAYTMLSLTIEHVSNHGITWMRQLLGVVLFWLPRAVWTSKPVGSGYYVAETLG